MLPTITSIIFLFRSGIQIWRLCVQIPVVYETPTETFIIVAGNIIWNALYIFFMGSYSNDIDPLARKYILQKPFYTQTVKICYFCFFLAQIFDFGVLWTNSRRRFTCLKIHELHFTLVYLHVYVPKYMHPRLLYYIHSFPGGSPTFTNFFLYHKWIFFLPFGIAKW